MAQNTKQRGTKILLASLSVAATLSGWAWLTATQPTVEADLVEETSDAAQTISMPVSLQAGIGASVSLPPRSNIPNLANLPVRGLREVGDAEFNPQPSSSQPQPQSQPPAVRERQHGNGGAQAQPQPQPQPQPKPKPARKAKSSK